MYWFRMYSEFAHDRKVQSMPESLQRRLVMLFCIQCESVGDSFQECRAIPDDDVAFELRLSAEDWRATKAIFMKRGFIDSENKVLNWAKRQKPSDSSTARVRKSRGKVESG